MEASTYRIKWMNLASFSQVITGNLMNTSYQKLNKIKGAIFIAPFFCFTKFLYYVCIEIKSETKNTKNMGLKGVLTTSDYVRFDEFQNLVNSLINDKNYKWAMYMSLSFSTGLRISDVLTIKWSDILDKQSLIKEEEKTGKTRHIRFSEETIKKFKFLYTKLRKPRLDSFVMSNKSGEAMSEQYINRILKQLKERYQLNVDNFSTHSIRKTFARTIWEKNNRSEESLVLLMEILNHSSMAITRRYLGITGDEIASIYHSIVF